ncbi:MAG: AAA family ATPase [Bacteroidales bacterium]|nr:AAA family ATPase [Bacteroidales bacterium]
MEKRLTPEKVDRLSGRQLKSGDNTDFEVDGIILDPDNKEFKFALQFALESKRNLYLTGKAGSGKTTFLRYLRKVSNKQMAVVAPTGIAATNAEGQTIHSFFNIRPSLYIPNDKRLRTYAPINDTDKSTIYDNFKLNRNKREIIRNLELLVIDEVSMVRADLLDVVDTLLRVFRNSHLPFGGVQVILIGDTFQLPPVVKGEERDLLLRFYNSEFFFSSKVIQQNKPLYIELKKIYRQNEQDFIDLLNRVRVNKMLPSDFQLLNSKVDPSFEPDATENYIILATKNDRVNEVNESKLAELAAPQRLYIAEVKGDFPVNNRPTDTELFLKVGAQVMFIKNDYEKRFCNGTLGVVTETNENGIKVEVGNGKGDRSVIVVNQMTWENIEYKWDEEEKQIREEVKGTFKQYPLRLAWAITVHKSQGLTFDKVNADIGNSFAPGQVYVALSRCTSLNGLVLTSPIVPSCVITDNRVLSFARNETPETLLTEQLSAGKADYYYGEVRKAFRAHNVSGMIENFYSALKYRNDVTTNTFRRYVSLWSQRLFDYLDMLQDTINEKDLSIKQSSDRINSLCLNLSDREVENQELKLALNHEKIKSSSEISKNEATQKELLTLKKTLEQVRIEKQEALRHINKLEERVEDQRVLLESVQKHMIEKDIEIERLRNLSWLQKLFGKK